MKWDHTDYTASNAHTALRFQKDVRWRARKNHRAFQMRRVRIGESRRQVSSWQLCYEERLFAAREVHGGVIPGQTSFLEPQVYSPCDPSSPLARVKSPGTHMQWLYQAAAPFSICSSRIQLHSKPETPLSVTTGPGHPSPLQ